MMHVCTCTVSCISLHFVLFKTNKTSKETVTRFSPNTVSKDQFQGKQGTDFWISAQESNRFRVIYWSPLHAYLHQLDCIALHCTLMWIMSFENVTVHDTIASWSKSWVCIIHLLFKLKLHCIKQLKSKSKKVSLLSLI